MVILLACSREMVPFLIETASPSSSSSSSIARPLLTTDASLIPPNALPRPSRVSVPTELCAEGIVPNIERVGGLGAGATGVVSKDMGVAEKEVKFDATLRDGEPGEEAGPGGDAVGEPVRSDEDVRGGIEGAERYTDRVPYRASRYLSVKRDPCTLFR